MIGFFLHLLCARYNTHTFRCIIASSLHRVDKDYHYYPHLKKKLGLR